MRIARRKVGRGSDSWSVLEANARSSEEKRDISLDELIRLIEYRNYRRFLLPDGETKQIDHVIYHDERLCTVIYKARDPETGALLKQRMRIVDVLEDYPQGDLHIR